MIINFVCTKCGAPNSDINVTDGVKTVACHYCNAANPVLNSITETLVVTEHKSNCWAVDDNHVVIGSPHCQGCGVMVSHGTTKHVKAAAPAVSIASKPTVSIDSVKPIALPGCFRCFGAVFGILIWIVSSILFGFVLFLVYGYLAQPYNQWNNSVFQSWIFQDWHWVTPWVYFEWVLHIILVPIAIIVALTPGLCYGVACVIQLFNVLIGWALWPSLMSGTITIGDLLKAVSNP